MNFKLSSAAFTLCAALLVPSTYAAVTPLELVKPIADYKVYVVGEINQLVADTHKFTDAIKQGDLERAKLLYAPTRVHYERIEPIAELFSDLDSSMDSRADDHEKREKDPGFTGFHRIEYTLYTENTTKGLDDLAGRLMKDVLDLQSKVKGLVFPPSKVVGGAASLMEEVAATKISGEEDRYSHTDLYDFQGNVDGSQKIVKLFSPLIKRENPAFLDKVNRNFAAVDKVLAKYRKPDGSFETYDKLTEPDRKALVGPVQVLAEDLSQLRGLLGLK